MEHTEPVLISRRATLQALGGLAAGAVLAGGADRGLAAPGDSAASEITVRSGGPLTVSISADGGRTTATGRSR